MTGVVVNGFDVEPEHIATVFEDLSTDIRRGNVHLSDVADAVEVTAGEAIEYSFEVSFVVDNNALLVDHLDGRLVETDVAESHNAGASQHTDDN